MLNVKERFVLTSFIVLVLIAVSPQKVFAAPKPLTDVTTETQPAPEPQRHEEHKSTPEPAPEPPKEERDTVVELQNEPDRLADHDSIQQVKIEVRLVDLDSYVIRELGVPFPATSSDTAKPIGPAYSGTPGIFNSVPSPGSGADTTVSRAPVPDHGPAAVPIEMVTLNLVSVEPVSVRYSSGDAEKWDVKVAPGGSAASKGEGGQFQSALPVTVSLTFTPQSAAATGEQVLEGLK